MSDFFHGGNIFEISRNENKKPLDYLDFSANINPLGLSSIGYKALEDNQWINSYPDIEYRDLKNIIAKYEKIDYETVFLGNGAVELFFFLVASQKPKKALIPVPTFMEYERACKGYDCEVSYFYLNAPEFKVNHSILEAIDETIDMLFLCYPNNPTGQLISERLLEKIVKKAELLDIVIVIDESFLEFVPQAFDGKELLSETNKIVIVKSLTKFFAIPGLRLGYALTENPLLIAGLEKVTPPWRINSLAQQVGSSILKDQYYIDKSIAYIQRENNWLYNQLSAIEGINVLYSKVNFMLFRVDKKIDIFNALLKMNIFIRNCNTFKGLDKNYYRLAVKSRADNIRLINAIKDTLNNKKR